MISVEKNRVDLFMSLIAAGPQLTDALA